MKKTYCLTVLLLAITVAQAQVINDPIGARAWMHGGTSAAATDVWAAANNAGAMAFVKNSQAGLYTEQRFMMSEMKLANVSGVLKTKYLNVGGFVNYYGYDLFNQQKIGLSVGKLLAENLALGVQINYLATNFGDNYYGNAHAWAGSIGVLYKPTSTLRTGLQLFNVTQAKYSATLTERIPTIGRLGLEYDVSKKVTTMLEADQMLNAQLVMRGGLRYQLHEILSLSVGAANNPVYYTFGTSIKIKTLNIDFASTFHQILGFTPHLGLIFPVK